MTLSFAPERIEHWPIAKLQAYARNAKTHGADQVAKIAASMAEFGWTVPCLVAEDGELIAGHGRVLAATQLGLTEAPVIVLGHLSEAQRRAYRIADNKLTELGAWDEALLSVELNDLLAEDFDLSLIGFDDAELEVLLGVGVIPRLHPVTAKTTFQRYLKPRLAGPVISGCLASIGCFVVMRRLPPMWQPF